MVLQLAIDQIFGASITNNASFSISDDTIVYTASGGVVVCSLKDSEICSQRFFCANHLLNLSSYASDCKSKDNIKTDLFGFPKLPCPIEITSGANNVSGANRLHHEDVNLNRTASVAAGSNSFANANNLVGSLSGSNSRLRDKVRTVSCVAMSPNKKLLAVGETGYQPRVLIYSLAKDSNDYPLAFISEHSFGVNCLAFSENSRYLVSLGVSTDAYMNIWRFAPATHFDIGLVGTNKCTSIVNNIIWKDHSIFTYGMRHIRVWSFEKSHENRSLVIIKGKNALLGNLLNENFIDAVIDKPSNTAYFLSDSGILCKLGLSQETFLVEPLIKLNSSAFHIHDGLLWWAEKTADSFVLNKTPLQNLQTAPVDIDLHKRNSLAGGVNNTYANKGGKAAVLAIRTVENQLIYINNSNEINIYRSDTGQSINLIEPIFKHICGLKKNAANKSLFWSEYGDIGILHNHDFKVEQIDSIDLIEGESVENKLTAMNIMNQNELLAGDRLGFCFIKNLSTQEYSYYAKIHESAINDITHFTINNYIFVVTVSRDRTIQVLYKQKLVNHKENMGEPNTIESQWDLLQTLTVHKANIIQVLSHENKFYVCSADRSVSSHIIEFDCEGNPYVECEKRISTRTTPVRMELVHSKNSSELVVSTNDKLLLIYSLKSLELLRTLKLYNESNSSLLLENYVVLKDHDLIICTCSDKSVRSFNYSSGRLLTINWGHSGLIVGLQLCEPSDSSKPKKLLTVSNDGCMFRWELKLDNDEFNPTSRIDNSGIKKLPSLLGNNILLNVKVQRKVVKSKSVSNLKLATNNGSLLRARNNNNGTSSLSHSLSSLSLSQDKTAKTPISTNKLASKINTTRSPSPTVKPSRRPTSSGSIQGSKSPRENTIMDLVNSLRAFRKVYATTGLLDAEKALIIQELNMTRKIFEGHHEKNKSLNSVSNDTAHLLETYSTELVKLVQQKLSKVDVNI